MTINQMTILILILMMKKNNSKVFWIKRNKISRFNTSHLGLKQAKRSQQLCKGLNSNKLKTGKINIVKEVVSISKVTGVEEINKVVVNEAK